MDHTSSLQISAEVFETHKIPMTKKERSNLRGRLGNLNNELGSFYQNRAREWLRRSADAGEDEETEGPPRQVLVLDHIYYRVTLVVAHLVKLT